MVPRLGSPRTLPSVPNLGCQSCCSRGFVTTSRIQNYESTLPNLRIGRHTRVIFQGFTGTDWTIEIPISIYCSNDCQQVDRYTFLPASMLPVL